jgi:hypothetical protein
MSKTLKTKLSRLRDKAKLNPSKEIRDQAMVIYRQRPEYMNKEDLILFGIIIKKDSCHAHSE